MSKQVSNSPERTNKTRIHSQSPENKHLYEDKGYRPENKTGDEELASLLDTDLDFEAQDDEKFDEDLEFFKARMINRESSLSKVNNQVTAEEIKAFYQAGENYLQQNKMEAAADEFAKALRPVLSKPGMRSIKVDIEEVLEETLSAMSHLGEIYLQSNKYVQNYVKAAGIFQFCASFEQEHKIGNGEYYLQKVEQVQRQFIENFSVKNPDNSIKAKALPNKTSHYQAQLQEVKDYCKAELEVLKPMMWL